jgi:hypothetical protein
MTDKRRIGLREIATLGQTGTACLKCADFVAEVGCCRWAVCHFAKSGGLDPPASEASTQLQRYAMHRA